MQNFTLITGASAGIGEALAQECAQMGRNLLLVARRRDRLEALRDELSQSHEINCEILVMDLSAPDSPEKLFQWCIEREFHISCLINNAGFGLCGTFPDLDLGRQLQMIDLNVRSLVELTHRFLGPMLAKGTGEILQNASVGGFQPGPGMNIYFATKAFVLHFTEALREEVRGKGIKVSCLCPGSTSTEFFEVANAKTLKMTPSGSMSSEQVAKIGMQGLLNNKGIVIPGLHNKFAANIQRFLPRSLVTRILGSLLLKRSK